MVDADYIEDRFIEEIEAEENLPFFEKVLYINRVTKVVKGGKKLGFSALVVVGDRNGKVGIGMSKAAEVPQAMTKAIEYAKKHLEEVPISGSTVLYPLTARFCASRIIIKPASSGTGIIAGGPVRAVLAAAGIKDAVCKSSGSNNCINVVKATMAALGKMRAISERHKIRKELQKESLDA
ncbi:TPA: 30S ribosomal protein S5 [bacterium]|nr:30S ribosomal protein S5 [bacterium]